MDYKYLSPYTAFNLDCRSIIDIIDKRFKKIKGALERHNHPTYFYDLMKSYLREVNRSEFQRKHFNINQLRRGILELSCETPDFLYIIKFELNLLSYYCNNIILIDETLVDIDNGEVLFSKKLSNKNYY